MYTFVSDDVPVLYSLRIPVPAFATQYVLAIDALIVIYLRAKKRILEAREVAKCSSPRSKRR